MAASDLIVSVSGIRGIIGDSLTPDIAVQFALALGTYLEGGKIVLSTDGRPSGGMLSQAVSSGLRATGCEIVDIGTAPTPTVGIAVKKLQAAGAIQITASHNPAPWNGLKLFGADGRVLTADKGREVQKLFADRQFRFVDWNNLGKYQLISKDPIRWHAERVMELVDTQKIAGQKIPTFLDANGGAGGILGRNLLAGFQCQSTTVGCECDGIFSHGPEPTAVNLQDVCPLVPQAKAQIGFVLDPDADRLALIDEKGVYIGEELTLALAVLFRLGQKAGPVVVNMSTSRIVEDLCGQFDVPFHRSAVGEANVADKMLEVDAVIGGEGNGGVIDPRVGFVRDPFIGMGLILNLLAERKQPLSEIVASLPKYTIVKDKYQVDRGLLPQLFLKIKDRWGDAKTNEADGLRLDWSNRWVHVRPSNTEPIVRVISEAPTGEEAQQLCKEVGDLLN